MTGGHFGLSAEHRSPVIFSPRSVRCSLHYPATVGTFPAPACVRLLPLIPANLSAAPRVGRRGFHGHLSTLPCLCPGHDLKPLRRTLFRPLESFMTSSVVLSGRLSFLWENRNNTTAQQDCRDRFELPYACVVN